ncbi:MULTISPECIES: nucleoside transporter C-terminal domain-containing protein [Methylobacterium]|jgi:CNT family concentrative nucleoside transporter|uniref:Nucleoside permease n=2 Tax=Methylobacterium TaxID=407 RepID=A0A0C6FM03_9HYPH|nr:MULTISPECIES: nucleoside transporter C-terminal domain-containing protein [Methylobacterium]MBK3398627.1 NupC/NupG family nucleoside CNT transporter [Methylobacterium ajmalii]MBK3411379.1 NupC/NupG family nucleoside CNT transporter [Methylobacterium ajmalii]MBK3425187.1 NupC/NupG family nucleoside CNT transporter [Methylobacterium ajmalii]MBZ6413217.1 NupC/NupG family nucleoside CNT transporter [Methylobacterium sp.]SFF43026.1 concentrative nucleoside transporter, CNT family [Methylobacteri
MPDRLIHAAASIALMIAVAVLFSTNRRAIRPRVVLSALAVQVTLGALVLFWPAGRTGLGAVADAVQAVLSYGDKGVAFLFGGLVEPKMFELFGGGGFVLALRVLPQIIYVSALIAVLYHFGVMQALARGLGAALQRVLGTSRIETFSAVITIFIGQSEIAVALRPFLALLTGAELFAVMTSGAASTAGSILAGYAALGVPMPYLLAASFMAIPGGLLYAKILVPSTEPSRVTTMQVTFGETRAVNVIEAAADGTQKGLAVAAAVGAMLIAFVGLIALLNGLVAYAGGLVGMPGASIEGGLGFVLAPLAWLLGVPWDQAILVGGAIGQKLAFNEFLAYANLSPVLKSGELGARTTAILCFALCGFANLSSIAIQLASFGSLVPERRSEVAAFGLRAILAGTLSNLTSAAIAGVFIGA